MKNFLSDQSNVQKTTVIDYKSLNFITNQEKRINKTCKKLIASNNLSEETQRHLKPVETRPGIMYGSGKVH